MTGSDFRKWRRDLGMKQTEAARALGITDRYVRTIEAASDTEIRRTLALACAAVWHRLDVWSEEAG